MAKNCQRRLRTAPNHIGVRRMVRRMGIEQKMIVYILLGIKPLLWLRHSFFEIFLNLSIFYKLKD